MAFLFGILKVLKRSAITARLKDFPRSAKAILDSGHGADPWQGGPCTEVIFRTLQVEWRAVVNPFHCHSAHMARKSIHSTYEYMCILVTKQF